MKERKVRVNDALHATRAAVEEGVVPGGGVALVRARSALLQVKGENDDQDAGIKIVLRALEEPLRQIATNAGMEASVVVNRVAAGTGAFGVNAANGTFGDLMEMGVIDPTKVTRTALQNAASVAGLILTTDCMIADLHGASPAPSMQIWNPERRFRLPPERRESRLSSPAHAHLILVGCVLRLRFAAVRMVQCIADAARQVHVGCRNDHLAVLFLDRHDPFERMLRSCPRRLVVHQPHDLVPMRLQECALEREIAGRKTVGDPAAGGAHMFDRPVRPGHPVIRTMLIHQSAGRTHRRPGGRCRSR